MGFCVGKSDLRELRLGLAKPLQAGKANLFLETGHCGQKEACTGSVAPSYLVGFLRGLPCKGPGLVSLPGKWVFPGAAAARSQPW